MALVVLPVQRGGARRQVHFSGLHCTNGSAQVPSCWGLHQARPYRNKASMPVSEGRPPTGSFGCPQHGQTDLCCSRQALCQALHLSSYRTPFDQLDTMDFL